MQSWLEYWYCGHKPVIFPIIIEHIQPYPASIFLPEKSYGFKTHLWDCNSSIKQNYFCHNEDSKPGMISLLDAIAAPPLAAFELYGYWEPGWANYVE